MNQTRSSGRSPRESLGHRKLERQQRGMPGPPRPRVRGSPARSPRSPSVPTAGPPRRPRGFPSSSSFLSLPFCFGGTWPAPAEAGRPPSASSLPHPRTSPSSRSPPASPPPRPPHSTPPRRSPGLPELPASPIPRPPHRPRPPRAPGLPEPPASRSRGPASWRRGRNRSASHLSPGLAGPAPLGPPPSGRGPANHQLPESARPPARASTRPPPRTHPDRARRGEAKADDDGAARRADGPRSLPRLTPRAHSGPVPAAAAAAAAGARPRGRAASARAARARRPPEVRAPLRRARPPGPRPELPPPGGPARACPARRRALLPGSRRGRGARSRDRPGLRAGAPGNPGRGRPGAPR